MKQNKNNIDLTDITRRLLARKKLVIRNIIIAGVVSAALILCVPRTYTCEVTLAPEFGNAAVTNPLAAMAASFGVNANSDVQSDAISPTLYPDLIDSKAFLVTLFPVKVKSEDGQINTDYYTYLTKHQASPWWKHITKWIKRTIKNIFTAPKPKGHSDYKHLDPFKLTEDDYNLAENISKLINCSVDRRSYVITIRVTDQDPLICACIADTVRVRLQEFIINYRTSKARVDVEYYEKLLESAQKDYDKAMKKYSAYADSHRDMIMQTYISERDNLENDMQMAFNVYLTVSKQLEAAKAKYQEAIPAFTTLKCASVPIKPSGPKRVAFVLGMTMLVFLATAFYILRGKKLKEKLKNTKDNDTSIN